MRSMRRHVPVLIIAVVLLGALVAPASAAKSFGQRFDNQVKQKLSKPGIINSSGNPVHWTQLKGVPGVFADGADNGLTDINDCPEGNAIRVIHGDATVECIAVATITGVTAGDGLTGGGDTGDIELDVDFTQTQERVTGTCSAGSSIREIKEDGTVTCDSSGGIAGGRVFDDGTKASSGTGTWTSTFVTDHYEITITGVTFSINSHIALITPIVCAGGDSATWRVDAVSGKIGVWFDKAGVDAQCGFHFKVMNL